MICWGRDWWYEGLIEGESARWVDIRDREPSMQQIHAVKVVMKVRAGDRGEIGMMYRCLVGGWGCEGLEGRDKRDERDERRSGMKEKCTGLVMHIL
jgi:hypothetical protein